MFLTSLLEVRLQLLALNLQFGHRLLDIAIVSHTIALQDRTIALASGGKLRLFESETVFLFVELRRPLDS